MQLFFALFLLQTDREALPKGKTVVEFVLTFIRCFRMLSVQRATNTDCLSTNCRQDHNQLNHVGIYAAHL